MRVEHNSTSRVATPCYLSICLFVSVSVFCPEGGGSSSVVVVVVVAAAADADADAVVASG